MFATERLTLRAFTASDMPFLMSVANDAEVQRFTWPETIVPRSAKYEEVIKGWVDKSDFFAIITLKAGDSLVGSVSLSQSYPKNRDATLSITLAREHWNKGYGTEVLRFVIDYGFKALALHRISLAVFTTNPRATAVYTKLGFVEEGRLRKALWFDGGWVDVTLMAILEDEWAERSRQGH